LQCRRLEAVWPLKWPCSGRLFLLTFFTFSYF
jgi:hypothetical protein